MGLTVGVDVGGTKVAAGVVDDDGVILAQLREPTPKTDTSAIAEVIAGMVDQLRADHPVEAVGVGAAGFIDAARTTVLFAPNLAWRDEPLADRVTKLIDLPVVVENDGNCHAWAEWRFGAARGAHAAVAVVVGTGIGGGMVVDGRLYRGGFGIAGEFGHVRIVPDGLPCGCGRRGCFEQYASGNALVRCARQRAADQPADASRLLDAVHGDVTRITGPAVTEAARDGDPVALCCFAEVGRWLGEGLADLAAVLDPDCFVIGGGVADAGDILLEPVRSAFDAALTGSAYRPHPAIRLAALGSAAGLVGAADLARRR